MSPDLILKEYENTIIQFSSKLNIEGAVIERKSHFPKSQNTFEQEKSLLNLAGGILELRN